MKIQRFRIDHNPCFLVHQMNVDVLEDNPGFDEAEVMAFIGCSKVLGVFLCFLREEKG